MSTEILTCAQGNTAKTWETLINHRKLPFMAMLRNLKNLINAKISDRHHKIILDKLTTEGSVISSRQFPFRFFSAFEVIEGLKAKAVCLKAV